MREMMYRGVGEVGGRPRGRGSGRQDAVDGEERGCWSDAVPGPGRGHGSRRARLELFLARVAVVVGHVMHTGHWLDSPLINV